MNLFLKTYWLEVQHEGGYPILRVQASSPLTDLDRTAISAFAVALFPDVGHVIIEGANTPLIDREEPHES